MNMGEFATGFGLGVCGAAFYTVSCWYVRSDARMHRLAESRWSFDKRTIGKLRRGEMSKDEWVQRFTLEQRRLVKWWFTPFVAVYLVLCVATVVHGFRAD
jgi:hypothetical protein